MKLSQTQECRPVSVGTAAALLGRLAAVLLIVRPRTRRGLASGGFPLVLALEVSPPSGKAASES